MLVGYSTANFCTQLSCPKEDVCMWLARNLGNVPEERPARKPCSTLEAQQHLTKACSRRLCDGTDMRDAVADAQCSKMPAA
ncbi:hypothetical protein Cob_v002283 [Colletotrichum orbiculare MAFF 240422]|uniref:Uncharacterized protein n=1 Tax=Colletotrichum orbiculare (strain 104-T / ATCC 96160 / CBS 514.97 / LARS 414 / MAFF 240422) TaxID=1213857 RepID=A0A484G4G5_COLOR|nr:hypothetical protein Cob_v002283 [Colletotrichum orbiculare MAFF 240422]